MNINYKYQYKINIYLYKKLLLLSILTTNIFFGKLVVTFFF